MADRVHARLSAEALDVAGVLARVRSDGDGAVCGFIGFIRDHSAAGPVTGLDYEVYEEMALPLLRRIAETALDAAGASAVAVEHRTGSLAVGEPGVVVAAAAAHRAQAFDACRALIEGLKAEVPIWKRERGPSGAAWVDATPVLSHSSPAGPGMVDVSEKEATGRRAVASGIVHCDPATARLLASGATAKGDVITTARLAGIMAAKRTGELIPLCHPLPLTHVEVALEVDAGLPGVRIQAAVTCHGRTGVEMEALTAVTVAGLTVIDMAKSADRWMTLDRIGLVRKEGGRSGSVARPPSRSLPAAPQTGAGGR